MKNLLSIAEQIRAAHAGVSEHGAFLPDRVPLDRLPPPYQRYLDACGGLAGRYPAARGGVREWLAEEFAKEDSAAMEGLGRLPILESWTLLTALAALGHTYRWDTVPPKPERLRERSVVLPAGLGRLWGALAAKMDQPRVGALWSLHLCNWRMIDRPGGARFRLDELSPERLRVAHQWLEPPASRHLEQFSLSFVLMEAKGGAVAAHVVGAIDAAARRDVQEFTYRLDVLQDAIHEMSKAFALIIRDNHVDPATWLELVQPTFAWGAEEGGKVPPGPNGMQMPIIQCLDSALGIEPASLLAQQARASRSAMPQPHRRFLEALDQTGGVIRAFAEETGSWILRRRYNDCLRELRKFRASHRARGSRYLQAGRYGSSGRISTGMGIEWRPPGGATAGELAVGASAPDDPIGEFQRRMDARIDDLDRTLLTGDDRGDEPTVENTFRFLSAEERAALIDSAPRRVYAKGEVIIRQGERRQALYVLEEGFVRIEVRDGARAATLAHLWPGEVFGEIAFLRNGEATAWTIADEEVEVRALDRESVYSVIGRAPGFAMRFYQSLAVQVASRLQETNSLLLQLGRPRE